MRNENRFIYTRCQMFILWTSFYGTEFILSNMKRQSHHCYAWCDIFWGCSNILNDFFVKESLIIGNNNVVPNLPPFSENRVLNDIHVTSGEVCDVLTVWPLGKAADPNMINNFDLRLAANEQFDPLCDLFKIVRWM